MLRSFGVLILMFSFLAHADDFEKEKSANQKIVENCVNPDVMDQREKETAEKMTASLKSFMLENSTDEERKRGFEGAIKMIVFKKDQTLFVFSKGGALATQPGSMLRTAERSLLSEKVTMWLKANAQFQVPQAFIRFDDECQVPDLCTDLYLDGSFLSRVRAFFMLCK